MFDLTLALQDGGDLLGGLFGGVCGLLYLGLIGVYLIGMWKVFEKAGQPGWHSLIPIVNLIVMVKIAKKEMLWVILLFIPLVNFVIIILLNIAIAEKFGKDSLFGLGLTFLGFIFYPMLGFGEAQYQDVPPEPLF